MLTAPITTLTPYEVDLMQAARALELREVAGEAIHLHVHRQRRRWLVQTPHGQLTFSVTDADLDPDLDLHLPLSDRVSWFTDASRHEQPSLGIVDGSTAVIGDEDLWAAIDLVHWHGEAPQPWAVRESASADVPLHRFLRTLTAARVLPTGADEQRHPWPPMWLHLGDNGVGLHVDWRDFLPSRATYTMAVESMQGTGTMNLPHRRIDDFMRSIAHAIDHHDDELLLTIALAEVYRDGGWEPAVTLRCSSWQLTVVAHDVLAERWAAQVEEQLEDFTITDRDPARWLVAVDQRPVHVRLYSGHPDVARVSAALSTGVDETLDLLRELSTLNGASTGVRYWFEDDAVWAAVDLPCARLADLASTVRTVAGAAADYGPLLGSWS